MQMFAALSYIQTQHPYGEIAGQPDQAPPSTFRNEKLNAEVTNGGSRGRQHASPDQAAGASVKTEPLTPSSDTADTFNNVLRELARDLVIQEQKAELLINSLPGIRNSAQDQERRMQELEAELKHVESTRAKAEIEKADLLRNLDRLIVGLRRIR